MKKKVFLAVALMAMMGGAAMAQSAFSLKLGGAFPMGDFADAKTSSNNIDRWGLLTKDNEGGAGTGFNVGLEWRFGIPSVSGLGLVVSVDGFYNGLNEDLRDFFEEAKDNMEDEYDDFSLTTPVYMNVPVMLGVNYNLKVADAVSLYATGAAGVNARIITPFAMEQEDHYTVNGSRYSTESKMTVTFNTTFTFGFRLAAGVTFSEKYSIELGYYNLGAGKVKLTEEEEYYDSYYSDTESGKEKETLKSITPEMVTLRFGIGF